MIITVDEQQKQIDSLTAMVTEMASDKQKENKELKERIEELEELNNIRHERIAKLEDAIGYTTNIGVHSLLAERVTKLEKLVSNGVTVREFDKLHEEVNDIHLSLVESEKKLKSQSEL